VAILSGLATYYPSSFKNDSDFGPAYGGQLVKFRSLGELRLDNASVDGSSIWGSICRELRTLLGASNSDRLLFEAWKQMGRASQPDSYARNFAIKSSICTTRPAARTPKRFAPCSSAAA
jgi:hypothetical protein